MQSSIKGVVFQFLDSFNALNIPKQPHHFFCLIAVLNLKKESSRNPPVGNTVSQ
jgi:hypothetical protein